MSASQAARDDAARIVAELSQHSEYSRKTRCRLFYAWFLGIRQTALPEQLYLNESGDDFEN